MNHRLKPYLLPLLAAGLLCAAFATFSTFSAHAADEKKPAPRAALTVTLTQPQTTRLPVKVAANGNVSAWQEASVGTEANGLRLAEVRANVGDVVKRGQVLAVFAPETVQANLAQVRASVVEAEAAAADAAANAARARELQTTGALSAQAINQYLTAERTAQARLEAAKANAQAARLRVAQTRVVAPDAGVISARSATVGAVLPAGQELFRLIRQGRLEWRAEVPANDLARIAVNMPARVTTATGLPPVIGKVRMVAPTIDAQTRNGIVYVDLPPGPAVKAGMYARGEFDIGETQALTLPQSAVVLREGFSYVMRVGADAKVTQVKVATGRRAGDRIEILGGLDAGARVVAAGGGFLAEGDTVKVVDSQAAAGQAVPASAPAPAASK